MAGYAEDQVLEQARLFADCSRHVGTNVTLCTWPEPGRLEEGSGQRNIHGGSNGDTRPDPLIRQPFLTTHQT